MRLELDPLPVHEGREVRLAGPRRAVCDRRTDLCVARVQDGRAGRCGPTETHPVTEELQTLARRVPDVGPVAAKWWVPSAVGRHTKIRCCDTRDETRTRIPQGVGDFESPASTDSATRAG